MNELIKSFGANAGRIWELLDREGPQVRTKIQKKTGLREEELYGAIGWLARENKIKRERRTYKIGSTNMTSTIGLNAGKVWEVLKRDDEVDVNAIARITKIEKRDCYSALGWLAREGKISTRTTVKKK